MINQKKSENVSCNEIHNGKSLFPGCSRINRKVTMYPVTRYAIVSDCPHVVHG